MFHNIEKILLLKIKKPNNKQVKNLKYFLKIIVQLLSSKRKKVKQYLDK